MNEQTNSGTAPAHEDRRYSLRAMKEEVEYERKNSNFGRQLVDSTEIEKIFSKRIQKKKRTL